MKAGQGILPCFTGQKPIDSFGARENVATSSFLFLQNAYLHQKRAKNAFFEPKRPFFCLKYEVENANKYLHDRKLAKKHKNCRKCRKNSIVFVHFIQKSKGREKAL